MDSGTIVAALVYALTGNVFAVGMASAVIRFGWLSPQIIVGFLAQRANRRMPYYMVGAFGRAGCLAAIAILLWLAGEPAAEWLAVGFLSIWTLYAFVSGVVAVPYNDIVGRSIPSALRSRMLALRFFVGGVLALLVAGVVHHLLAVLPLAHAYATIFALASALMVLSSVSFVSAGEPPLPAVRNDTKETFPTFLKQGRSVLFNDRQFRIFLYTQWLSGATLMALPFYVVAWVSLGLEVQAVALMLGAQTAGALATNAVWGQIGDTFGKLKLLEVVGVIRLAPPAITLALLIVQPSTSILLGLAIAVFFVIGGLTNGMTIGYLGYLMEISPNERRPAYSAYFNVLYAPAALLPLAGAAVATASSLHVVFVLAVLGALAQLYMYQRLRLLPEN